jgi:hypothetical protein
MEYTFTLIYIWTQNGFYEEVLNFRKAKAGTSAWAIEYHIQPFDVSQQRKEAKKTGKVAFRQNYIRGCYQQWSDENPFVE